VRGAYRLGPSVTDTDHHQSRPMLRATVLLFHPLLVLEVVAGRGVDRGSGGHCHRARVSAAPAPCPPPAPGPRVPPESSPPRGGGRLTCGGSSRTRHVCGGGSGGANELALILKLRLLLVGWCVFESLMVP
jgi:hypothetical protein